MTERDYTGSLARVWQFRTPKGDPALAADCMRVMQAMAEGKLVEIQDTGHSHAYRRFIVRTDNGLFEHDADPLTAALKALEARDAE